jgi:hypothetical protein
VIVGNDYTRFHGKSSQFQNLTGNLSRRCRIPNTRLPVLVVL